MVFGIWYLVSPSFEDVYLVLPSFEDVCLVGQKWSATLFRFFESAPEQYFLFLFYSNFDLILIFISFVCLVGQQWSGPLNRPLSNALHHLSIPSNQIEKRNKANLFMGTI